MNCQHRRVGYTIPSYCMDCGAQLDEGIKTVEMLKVESVPDDRLDEQIRIRQLLRSTMVGKLYPAVLTDEIDTLLARKK